jgi:hypothetical protein
MEWKGKKQRKKKEILNKFYPIYPLPYPYQNRSIIVSTAFCNEYE